MNQSSFNENQCKEGRRHTASFFQEIPSIVERLVASCDTKPSFHHVDLTPIPSQEKIVEIIHQSRRILFPGYFSRRALDRHHLADSLGVETRELLERLSAQITLSLQHDCLRYERPCSECIERSHETTLTYIRALPEIKNVLVTDIRAAMQGDPAAKSTDEIIFSYPGLFAITVFRLANVLYELDIPLLPRMMTEFAHSRTGIDIHPGAKIGNSFFIDHGTGVVVGETTEIGDRVRLYQGVTLGALSLPTDAADRFRNKKRHPTIEDDVIIYSNATLLGEKAVIGARSVIGGNVWITDQVPPDTKVLLKRPELRVIGNHKK